MRSRIYDYLGFAAAFAIVFIIGSCSNGSDTAPPPPRDAAAQRAVDSTVGASKLPGAQGVQGALKAQDSAAARQRQLDSLSKAP
jgi:hypothetical protein